MVTSVTVPVPKADTSSGAVADPVREYCLSVGCDSDFEQSTCRDAAWKLAYHTQKWHTHVCLLRPVWGIGNQSSSAGGLSVLDGSLLTGAA